jgi:GTP 3',8-cyclase
LEAELPEAFRSHRHPPPSVVEIEVNSRCNRRCSYCPNVLSPAYGVPNLMERCVFERILDQLRQIGFCGRLSYHFFNEPLLRIDLEELVRRARRALPETFQVLYSNGDHLSDDRYAALIDAGIDHFMITRHGYEPMQPRRFQSVRFPQALDISNRGGAFRTIDRPLSRPCFAPWEMLIVTVTGEVVLCHEDAWRSTILGDLASQDLEEIWFGEPASKLRDVLAAGLRSDAASVCRSCDHRAYPGPNMAI